jgi:hypothetical protein
MKPRLTSSALSTTGSEFAVDNVFDKANTHPRTKVFAVIEVLPSCPAKEMGK